MSDLIFGPIRPRKTQDSSNETRDDVYTIGIDAGSKTIKVAVFDATGNLVYSTYDRHRTHVGRTLADALHDVRWRVGDVKARIAVTGSAGIEAAQLLDVPFVQEVVSVTRAVKHAYPDADAIIELGGEDSKVVYLTGGLEQRMNSTCAGGTGGFIDAIAFMLGVDSERMSSLALGHLRTYPIASRCAVFAQTDVRPLLNAGASKADIAASVHNAVVKQTLGGLACGRPIQGKVVFLGGPLWFNDDLVYRFRKALNLKRDDSIRPTDAHLFTAFGAALLAEESDAIVTLGVMEDELRKGDFGGTSEGDLERLPKLFEDEEALAAFKEEHAGPLYPRADLFNAEGPLYVGIDAGSTTAKVALLDAEGRLLYRAYEMNEGDVLETVRQMLIEMYTRIPHRVRPGSTEADLPYIAASAATGYGEDVLMAAFGVDSGVVETVAHAKAALTLEPDASFVLDIGGQDMKALWIKDGHVQDAVLNEACSSGCGSFLGGTAHAVRENESTFAEKALYAESPVDLGTRCTVFMSSRVKHAQKVGASVEDIAAGCAYSVVQNALYRIIGDERAAKIGNKAVVQGGTFKSDAVLRAFEVLSGVEAVRPDQADLMGAIGAALVARERHQAAGSPVRKSSLLTADELEHFEYGRRSITCDGCQNSCALSVLTFDDDRSYVSGNKCERGKFLALNRAPFEGAHAEKDQFKAPNLIQLEQQLLARFADTSAASDRDAVKLGLPTSLNAYESLPFWHTLFSHLGFDVLTPEPDCEHQAGPEAWQTVSAESVCYPAKLMHPRAFSLREKGATHLFLPAFERHRHCAIACDYADSLIDGIDFLRDDEVKSVRPVLANTVPHRICSHEEDVQSLRRCVQELCEEADVPLRSGEFRSALEAASAAQSSFESLLQTATDKALDWLAEDEDRHGIVLAGRPYHVDKALSHGIDQMLQDLGFAVLGQVGLREQFRAMPGTYRPLEHDWRAAKPLIRAARYVSWNDQLDLVCLYSFGCSYDAVSLEEVQLVLESAGKTFTALKTDEMVDVSHVRIRLRTLADIIRSASPQPRTDSRRGAGVASSRSKTERMTGLDRKTACGLTPEDIMRARSSTPSDVCFAARALAGRVLSYLDENPEAQVVHLPHVCIECLEEAVPTMVELATGKSPDYVWDDDLSCFADLVPQSETTEQSGADDAGPRPKIGILGNAMHSFDPLMNDDLVEMLERLGCEPALPDPQALLADDVRYEDQVERFVAQGIEDIIYVQSFGCTKANVHVRGGMHHLKERFPTMHMTVIDFDPDSSELNRENRVRLAVEAAMQRSCNASDR